MNMVSIVRESRNGRRVAAVEDMGLHDGAMSGSDERYTIPWGLLENEDLAAGGRPFRTVGEDAGLIRCMRKGPFDRCLSRLIAAFVVLARWYKTSRHPMTYTVDLLPTDQKRLANSSAHFFTMNSPVCILYLLTRTGHEQ